MSAEKDDAVKTLLGCKLADIATKADAVVLIFGTGSVFLRPKPGEPTVLDQPAHHIDITWDDERRVSRVSVKAAKS